MPFDELGKEVYKDPVTTRECNPVFVSEDFRRFQVLLKIDINE